ncbi:AMP-binding enzyme [Nitzschia inconspicua]|uniref:AMP-binding enzyme n=1 Tax=Nitzschia inconspicua TaxID=303405 RepID=A0A9K3LWJ9_9STRA|nr:AMP-binding enzyme [Nitzschia inconspicua]
MHPGIVPYSPKPNFVGSSGQPPSPARSMQSHHSTTTVSTAHYKAHPLRGGNSPSLVSPIVSACKHLLQPNGSIIGNDVAKAVLPNFSDLCSALPVQSFGKRPAFYGVDGNRRPITHERIRDFILKEFGPSLHEFGFGRGQRIALVLPNGPELALAILAVAHWASCVPLNANGAVSELKKDLQHCSAKMIIGMGTSDSAAIQDMARALNIPFYGLVASEEEVGIFRLLPMSLPNKVPIGVAQQANALYEHTLMMIQSGDSADAASCCGTVSTAKQQLGYGSNNVPYSLERLATYNYLSNDHEDEVLVLFTSGTTGNKKLVPHKLGDMMIAAAVIAVSWNLNPDDINCNLMPLFHVGGIVRQVFAPILSAGSVICCPSFDAHLFWQLLLGQHPGVGTTLPGSFTWYYAAPTMHQVILGNIPCVTDGSDDNLLGSPGTQIPDPIFVKTCEGGRRHLRMIANAAGGLLPSLAQELRATFGANVLPSYGMTECMPISSPPYNYELTKPGTSGVAVGPQITIFNNNFEVLPPGKEGNICVRGRPCFRGYGITGAMHSLSSGGHGPQKAPKALLEGGWFNTGDLGYLDEDGYLYITGRSKEVINRGGEIISPLEVEEEIVQHPSIQACAAFSAPHSVLQEAVGIVLVHKPGVRRLDLPTLHEFLQDRLAPAKWPQCIVYMNALPKSHTNKLLRVKLGQRLNLPELNDNMFPVERTFEATCPPQGTLVGVSIPSVAVTVDLEYIQAILRQELQIFEDISHQHNGGNGILLAPPDLSNDSLQQTTQPRRQLLVTSHPSRIGSVTVHVYNVKPEDVIHTAQRVFDAYLRPSHVCSYTSEISLQNIKKYPENTDAVACILNGDGTKKIITDPMVRKMQELVQDLINLDCLPAPDSSFFHVGGSSLLASQMASRIRKAYNVDFSGTDVFRHNTCISMAHRVQAQLPEFKSLANSSMESGSTKSISSNSNNNSRESSTPAGKATSKRCSVDLQNIPLELNPMKPETGCFGTLFQLFPLFGFFPLYQFSRFFLFFMSLLAILHKTPGEHNILKFIFTVVAFHFMWTLITPLIFVLIKWIVIGKYQEGRYPIWGRYYLRWWFVDICRKVIGRGVWGSHNVLLCMYYQMLGAKIGSGTRISLEAEVAEYDLVTIGDDAKIEYSTVRAFGVDNGTMILGKVSIGDRSSVGVRSVVAPYTSVPSDAHVGPGTSSYEITYNDDRHVKYNRYAFPEPALWIKLLVGSPIVFFVNTISHIPAMTVLYMLVSMHLRDRNGGFQDVGDLMRWLCEPKRIPYYVGIRIARSLLAPFFYMFTAILVKWIIIGKFQRGPRNVSNQWTLLRHWLAATLFSRENMQEVTDLLGRHYETVSVLYRLLGAKVGKRVFWPGHQFVFSGEFDLLEIGDDVVFGSRSVVLCSTMESSEKVIFCAGSNVSDNTIVLPGGIIGKNAVLASNTVCPPNRYMPEASIYLGSRGGEPIVLEPGTERDAKEVMLSTNVKESELQLVGDDTTLRPFGKAVYKREATYFVWPCFFMILYRFVCNILFETIHALPLLGSLHITGGIFYGFPIANRDYDSIDYSASVLYGTMFGAYLLTHAIRIFICLAVEIAAKWMLMGRRSQGRYNWDTSNYGQNWELYQILTCIRKLHRTTILDFLAGSPYLNAYFRCLGSSIGKDCCLYPAGADPFMPEPDMVKFGDRCVIDMASIVSHLNTRGNFELVRIVMEDHVTLRCRSRIQQGVFMETGAMLMEKSLALTGEVLDADTVWQGAPASKVYGYERGVSTSNGAYTTLV